MEILLNTVLHNSVDIGKRGLISVGFRVRIEVAAQDDKVSIRPVKITVKIQIIKTYFRRVSDEFLRIIPS